MNRTQHYQLCQWAAEDKVQRVDFNADNAKIDAALRGAYPVLLKRCTSDEEAKEVTFEFPGIEWGKYAFVVLELVFPTPATFFVRFNGGGTYTYYPNLGGDNMSALAWEACTLYRILCPVFYKDNLPMQLFGMGKEYCMGMSKLPLCEIQTMELEAHNTKAPADARIPAGAQLLIWGLQ